MTKRFKIVHRWGKQWGWYVRIPEDFRSPSNPQGHRFFGRDDDALNDAKAYARQLRDARKSHGEAFLKLPIWQQNELLRAGERIGWDNLRIACDMFEENRPKSSRPFSEAAVQYLAEAENPENDGESPMRKNSRQNLKCSTNSFAEFIGTKPLSKISGQDVTDWLKSKKWAPKTKLGRLKDIETIFSKEVKRRHISFNPCDSVTRPKVNQKDRQIFHVSEVRVLLNTILKHDVALLGYICPDLFGGLRPFESKRICTEDVSAGQINLDGSKTKKRRSRTVMLNPTLKAWLSVAGVAFEHVNLAKRMRKIREMSGKELGKPFPWDHDIVRHTFCSNAVHSFGFKETSILACTSEENLKTTYFTLIKNPDDVKEFWLLRPV